MRLIFKEMEKKINDAITEKQKELKTHYQTLDEVDEYGWTTVFNANNEEETIKSSFSSGRAIGEIEGEIYQLQKFLDFLYYQEYLKEEKNE